MDKIIVSDKMYVPSHHIPEKRVKKHYFRGFYSDFGCRGCDNRENRPSGCQGCENFGGFYKLANRRVIGNTEYYGLPLGDRENIEEKMKIDFDDFKIVDKRCKQTFDYKIKIDLGEDRDWFDYQLKTIAKMIKARFGLFVLPPRSGKSLTGLNIGISLGFKMLIIADQYDFLNQFIGDIEESTNLPALQEKTGKKLYGFIKDKKDLKHIQIGIITYQSFLSSKGQKLLKACNKVFGTWLVDEVQSTGAPEFSNVMNSSTARVRIGCTGTEKRKDGKHVITEMVIGPVKSRIKRGQMVAKLIAVDTGFKSKGVFRGKAGYTFLGKALAKNEKRNQFILDWVKKDLEKGHSIVIPLHFKDHIMEMVRRINAMMGYEVAAEFVGGGGKKNKNRRDQVKELAKQRKIRVVVGIRKLLQRGINIPPWSALYYVMPMNNDHNWKQESSRILTPDPTKREPIIRFFVDTKAKASLTYCGKTWEHSLKFQHTPTPEAQKRMAQWLAGCKRDISYEDTESETVVSDVGRAPSGGLFGGIASKIQREKGRR